jgi:predicted MFS family arabinose efflux permease
VVSGCVLLAASAVVVAAAPGPMVLAVGVIAAGGSAGATWAPFSDAVAQQVPGSGRARALALVNAGAPIGLLLAGGVALASGERWRLAWVLFAGLGAAAAVVNLLALRTRRLPARPGSGFPPRGLFGGRSIRLFAVTVGISFTSGAYFTYAPETVRSGDLPAWIGAVMWIVLGAAGGTAGIFGGHVAERFSRRAGMAAMSAVLAASMLLLLPASASAPAALLSAAVFGIAFTVGFALIVIWSQHVFPDRPATGFTVAILFLAGGFALGPAVFGLVAVGAGRGLAVAVAALPAVIAGAIPPAGADRAEGTSKEGSSRSARSERSN